MNGYFGMAEYKFAAETAIYPDVICWLAKYGISYEASLEYSLPGVTFRMVTVKIKTAPELIIKDINQMLNDVRKNNEWRKSKKG